MFQTLTDSFEKATQLLQKASARSTPFPDHPPSRAIVGQDTEVTQRQIEKEDLEQLTISQDLIFQLNKKMVANQKEILREQTAAMHEQQMDQISQFHKVQTTQIQNQFKSFNQMADMLKENAPPNKPANTQQDTQKFAANKSATQSKTKTLRKPITKSKAPIISPEVMVVPAVIERPPAVEMSDILDLKQGLANINSTIAHIIDIVKTKEQTGPVEAVRVIDKETQADIPKIEPNTTKASTSIQTANPSTIITENVQAVEPLDVLLKLDYPETVSNPTKHLSSFNYRAVRTQISKISKMSSAVSNMKDESLAGSDDQASPDSEDPFADLLDRDRIRTAVNYNMNSANNEVEPNMPPKISPPITKTAKASKEEGKNYMSKSRKEEDKKPTVKTRIAVKKPKKKDPVWSKVNMKTPMPPSPERLALSPTSTNRSTRPANFYNVRLSNAPVFLRRTSIRPPTLAFLGNSVQKVNSRPPRLHLTYIALYALI